MTRSEKRHLDRVSELGCAVCGSPAEIHHPRFAAGMAQRSPHFLAIGLCAQHHRTGGHGVALHAGQATFEGLYGSEAELLAATIEKLTGGNK